MDMCEVVLLNTFVDLFFNPMGIKYNRYKEKRKLSEDYNII